ncbi:FadR/GntR family transcriptional regulator [Amycolatopsis sp. BJA-103]|uniref:FadR/GntR family transcriptional regulator n=1 Tax=unclassified Amycolatopsis TaxID=2618356 RepID=UPI000C755D4B|nr:FCD domain-containing protein [Amycolatopsis sp. BJA-103]AUI63744.1 GntR family transcriptional regulator [Amycolatopsis sp. BJA-103]PNE19589.1 GntR family transcriptional regulator [Amycolatopsis sp. BJA-103]
MRKGMSHSARSAMFAPLDQIGRAEAVTARLVDAITLGLLADSEQLPSEAELAAQFGVSTVTVREALVALRQQGLVETRRGRGGGSFVKTPVDPSAASWRERLRTVSLSDLRDVGDHYLAIAGAAAKLAAERSSPEDIERLELATEDIRIATGAEASRAERQFHLEVAAAAQSPRLTREEVQLQSERGGLLWLPLEPHGTRENAYAEHRAITAAIALGDGELARKLTEEHILEAIDRLADVHLDLLAP